MSMAVWYKTTASDRHRVDRNHDRDMSQMLRRACRLDERHKISMWEMLKHRKTAFTGDRIGVLLCVPFKSNHYFTLQFLTFVYASWKVVNEHAVELETMLDPHAVFNRVDLLVFCEPPSCDGLPDECVEWKARPESELESHGNVPRCHMFPTKGFNTIYPNVNSYCYTKSDAFHLLVPRYRYMLRTDVDVFLSPAMLLWQPDMPIVTGQGGYCVQFNMNRLSKMAARYGLRHQGVHCLGSTWFGTSQLIYNLSSLTVPLTMSIFETEFDPVRHPDIAVFMQRSAHGDWPSWWRPVSSMYGQELAVNHMVDGLTVRNIKRNLLDVESCRRTNVLFHLHIHTWHSDCEFNKFKFLDPLVLNVSSNLRFIVDLRYIRPTLVSCMSVADYCTYVAQNSLFRYTMEIGKLRGSIPSGHSPLYPMFGMHEFA